MPLAPCAESRLSFRNRERKKFPYDYATLAIHQCKKADVTRYAKYQQKQLKADMAKSATSRSKKKMGRRTYDKKFQKEKQGLD